MKGTGLFWIIEHLFVMVYLIFTFFNDFKLMFVIIFWEWPCHFFNSRFLAFYIRIHSCKHNLK